VTFAAHARITGHALKTWAIAQLQEATLELADAGDARDYSDTGGLTVV
jgi:hypothetical protein